MATSSTMKSPVKKPSLQIIRGLPITTSFKKEIIEEILDYMPHNDDVIVASYPKTGSTWMQYIVLQILTKGELFPTFNDLKDKISPFLEMAGISAVEAITTRPRVYKHHFPYNMLKTNPNAKIIYVYRKPEDTFVSYFHFLKNMGSPMDFDEYFQDFLTGDISYGRYFEHVLTYLHRKDNQNILLVSYEKLHANQKEETLRVAKFLGEDFFSNIVNNGLVLDKIMEHTSFDYMKKHLKMTLQEERVDKCGEHRVVKEVNFFRKGTVGDGKNALNSDQLKSIRRLAEEIMKGTDILNEWYNE